MNYPVYFGEYPPPLQTPDGVVTEYIRLGNGIYLVRSSSNKTMLAISSPISELELTIYADHESYVVNDYSFFIEAGIAIPL